MPIVRRKKLNSNDLMVVEDRSNSFEDQSNGEEMDSLINDHGYRPTNASVIMSSPDNDGSVEVVATSMLMLDDEHARQQRFLNKRILSSPLAFMLVTVFVITLLLGIITDLLEYKELIHLPDRTSATTIIDKETQLLQNNYRNDNNDAKQDKLAAINIFESESKPVYHISIYNGNGHLVTQIFNKIGGTIYWDWADAKGNAPMKTSNGITRLIYSSPPMIPILNRWYSRLILENEYTLTTLFYALIGMKYRPKLKSTQNYVLVLREDPNIFHQYGSNTAYTCLQLRKQYPNADENIIYYTTQTALNAIRTQAQSKNSNKRSLIRQTARQTSSLDYMNDDISTTMEDDDSNKNKYISGPQRWLGYILETTCQAKFLSPETYDNDNENDNNVNNLVVAPSTGVSWMPSGEFLVPLFSSSTSTEVPTKIPQYDIMNELRSKMFETLSSFSTLRKPKAVLLLLRETRRLVDLESGSAKTVVDAMAELGLPVYVANMGTLPPSEQVELIANKAAILVSVHGADLTNMLWMQPNTHVVEVHMRYGWCCDPVPDHAIAPEPTNPGQCSGRGRRHRNHNNNKKCKPYHKADYYNMAKYVLNLKYTYFDADYTNPPNNSNPISRDAIFVNSTNLANVVYDAYMNYIMRR